LFAALSVTRGRAQVSTRVEHTFSLHAIGRWYQRSGLRDDADLLAALTAALAIVPADHFTGADLPVATLHGHWRGRIKQRTHADGNITARWCARTWVGACDV
jgi:hypothetical protein